MVLCHDRSAQPCDSVLGTGDLQLIYGIVSSKQILFAASTAASSGSKRVTGASQIAKLFSYPMLWVSNVKEEIS